MQQWRPIWMGRPFHWNHWACTERELLLLVSCSQLVRALLVGFHFLNRGAIVWNCNRTFRKWTPQDTLNLRTSSRGMEEHMHREYMPLVWQVHNTSLFACYCWWYANILFLGQYLNRTRDCLLLIHWFTWLFCSIKFLMFLDFYYFIG